MKKFLSSLLLGILAFSMYGCETISSESERISANMNNVVSETEPTLQAIGYKIFDSDGIIEPMDSNELITKLAALHNGLKLDDVIKIFGKEPFVVQESNADIFKATPHKACQKKKKVV